MSGTDSSREALTFLQRRVALFGLASGGLGLIFLLFRAVVSISASEYAELVEPSFVYHLVAVVVALAAWLACRTGTRTLRFVHGAEALALVGASVAYHLMGWHIPLANRPDMIVLLAITYSFMARSAYVPSPARRTLLLSLAVGVPLVIGTYVMYLGADETFLRGASLANPHPPAAQFARMSAMSIAVWWSLTTVLATAISSVIYGLRRDVREARKLGQYTLEEKLGEGGMGVVYRASHAMLRRPTAVKLLPTEKAGEQSIARFEREVQLTAAPDPSQHRHRLRFRPHARRRLLLRDGAPRRRRPRRARGVDGAQPPERALHILDGVAGALAEAHEIGLIHRDVKPANIILCKQGGALRRAEGRGLRPGEGPERRRKPR